MKAVDAHGIYGASKGANN
jgi:hypothetical protein